MKKKLFATILCLISTGAIATSLPKVTFLTDTGFIPFEWQDSQTKEWKGFDVELLHALGKRAGYQPVLKSMEFDGIIPALEEHGADAAIAAMGITKKREKVIDFSDPYYFSGMSFLVRSDNNTITGIPSLSGKKVAVKVGTTNYSYLKAHMPKGTQLLTYPDSSDTYIALETGNADAVFNDAPNLQYFVHHQGKGKFKVVPKEYNGSSYGIVFAKGDKWLAPTNKALAEMKADGSYQKLVNKYFGKTI